MSNLVSRLTGHTSSNPIVYILIGQTINWVVFITVIYLPIYRAVVAHGFPFYKGHPLHSSVEGIILMNVAILFCRQALNYTAVTNLGKLQKLATWITLVMGAGNLLCLYAEAYYITGLKSAASSKLEFSDYLYFSVITWTTTGYGDIYPASQLAKFFAALEACNGYVGFAVLLSGFVNIFYRKLNDA